MSKRDLSAVARDPAARRIIRDWRRLTGGRAVRDPDRRTLVACSGGADSAALALSLASASEHLAIAHVVHDFRPAEVTRAERDAVRDLASSLRVPFHGGYVAVARLRGNAEGNARRARYRSLSGMADRAGCSFVATGHQANDQLETMLMALLRGAGTRGLSGIAPDRLLGREGLRVIRPMLHVSRGDAERICGLASYDYASDPTNDDTSRFRASLRAGPVRQIASLRPAGLLKACEAADHLREVAGLLDRLAASLLERAEADGDGYAWARAELASAEPVVTGAALRLAFSSLHGGRLTDRLPARSVRRAVEMIGDGSGAERRLVWIGAEVIVRSDQVLLRRSDGRG